MSGHSYDSHTRSVVKTITWKTLALTLGFAVTYWISGDFVISTKVSTVMFVAGLFAFYFHERVWNNIEWGKIRDN